MIAALFFLLFVGTLWAMYWALVRPVILSKVAFNFERLRSQVEWALIEGLPEAETPLATKFLAHLESADAAQSLSMGVLVYALSRGHRPAALRETEGAASSTSRPAWLREACETDMMLTTGAALANSPVWWPFVATVLLVAYFSDKTARWWHDLQTVALLSRDERFVRLAV